MARDGQRHTVRINTSDMNWIRRHASEDDAVVYGTDIQGHVYFQVEIQIPEIERVRFAGAEMIRFDLGDDLPSDAMNRWTMVPASYLVK